MTATQKGAFLILWANEKTVRFTKIVVITVVSEAGGSFSIVLFH